MGPAKPPIFAEASKPPIPENDELDRFNPVFINFSIFIPEKSLGERTITCQTCHGARRSLLVGPRLVRQPRWVTWKAMPWCCKEFEAHLGDLVGDEPRVDYGYQDESCSGFDQSLARSGSRFPVVLGVRQIWLPLRSRTA